MTRLSRTRRWLILVCFVLLVWTIFSPKLFAQDAAGSLNEREQERFINLATNMKNRMSATLVRLWQINERIHVPVAELLGQEVDVSSGEIVLNNATRLLTEVSSEKALKGMDEMIIATFTSENPRDDWPELKAKFIETKRLLGEARQQLLLGAERVRLIEIAHLSGTALPSAETSSSTASTTMEASDLSATTTPSS